MSTMKRLLVVLLFALTVRLSALEVSDLAGTWKLLSAVSTVAATGEKSEVYGPTPDGYLSYGVDGRFSAIIAWGPRPKPADLSKVTDEERIKLYRTMFSYAGTYHLDGTTVTHSVDISSNETWTGTKQIRFPRLEGDRLFIRTMTQPRLTDGKVAYTELVWTRIRSNEGPKK